MLENESGKVVMGEIFTQIERDDDEIINQNEDKSLQMSVMVNSIVEIIKKIIANQHDSTSYQLMQ